MSRFRLIRKSYRSLIFIIVFIFFLMSIPKEITEHMRGHAVALLAPFWKKASDGKVWVKSLFPKGRAVFRADKQNLTIPEEVQRLLLENERLRMELLRLQSFHEREFFVEQKLEELKKSLFEVEEIKKVSRKHYQELTNFLKLQLQAIPARVIYRDPAFWDSSLWVDVGQEDNERLQYDVVLRNSPVMLGPSVVGVVDYVGRRQSRIRLITDLGLNPSVRAVRGHFQNVVLLEHVNALIEALTMRDDLFFSEEFHLSVLQNMRFLQKHLNQDSEEIFLAKGILKGSKKVAYRHPGKILQGLGFNYDFSDDRGYARDLRSGKIIGETNASSPEVPILKVNDLLVTTGMDGVFPEGLRVAEVTKIELLKEGGYVYDLEAKPTAGDLDDLNIVYIMPPVGYDWNDRPPFLR